jgi:hypothetical protein
MGRSPSPPHLPAPSHQREDDSVGRVHGLNLALTFLMAKLLKGAQGVLVLARVPLRHGIVVELVAVVALQETDLLVQLNVVRPEAIHLQVPHQMLSPPSCWPMAPARPEGPARGNLIAELFCGRLLVPQLAFQLQVALPEAVPLARHDGEEPRFAVLGRRRHRACDARHMRCIY